MAEANEYLVSDSHTYSLQKEKNNLPGNCNNNIVDLTHFAICILHMKLHWLASMVIRWNLQGLSRIYKQIYQMMSDFTAMVHIVMQMRPIGLAFIMKMDDARRFIIQTQFLFCYTQAKLEGTYFYSLLSIRFITQDTVHVYIAASNANYLAYHRYKMLNFLGIFKRGEWAKTNTAPGSGYTDTFVSAFRPNNNNFTDAWHFPWKKLKQPLMPVLLTHQVVLNYLWRWKTLFAMPQT